MSERNLPRPAPDAVEDGVPATEEVREDQLRTGDSGVPDMPIPDRPWAAEDEGTTPHEQREGEPLGRRLGRERPEQEGAAPAGERVLEPGAEEGLADLEADAVAEEDLASSDTLSAEEAALSVRADPGGMTENEDSGYLEETP